ncbi:MAG: 50S ribosomal protein L18 [Acidimicrobiales bacterium]|jgi:large subunit ribosomal protein L18
MSKTLRTHELANRRHRRVRKHVIGTIERPRLTVFRSNKHIVAQIVDDTAGRTLVAASTLEAGQRGGATGNIAAAKEIGKLVASRALSQGVTKVVFDRGSSRYHGRVAALAEAAREAGLEL